MEERTATEYEAFIASKRFIAEPCGFDVGPDALDDYFFPFQRDIVRWALRRGKAAIFEGTGLGKTIQQLTWAREVAKRAGGRVLILAPLAVGHQTAAEAARFEIDARYRASADEIGDEPIVVTNYERLHLFDPARFVGVVLDESSILKSYSGATRNAIIDAFRATPYKLAATATPAPNDYMELGNHAEFLGVMTRAEMLAMFFTHDGGETRTWRLKGHARKDFWRWVCSWAVMLRTPSDLGYADGDFALPPLNLHHEIVEGAPAPQGTLFAVDARTLVERRAARKASLTGRVERCAARINADREAWIVWCDLNAEADALCAAIPDAVQIAGSDDPDVKARRMLDFAAGNIRVLVTKPSIAGFGMNWQHCARMAFVGLSDSWEQYYQAIRRCWRFGQTRPVEVFVYTSDVEGAVVANIERKERDAARMAEEMVREMQDLNREALGATERETDTYLRGSEGGEGWTAHLGDCVDVLGATAEGSIDYSIFSPPFASLYTYSNSPRDMGNVRTHAEFYEHFSFLVRELYRVLRPGRLLSFHCMNLPTSKARDGVIGISDFRGDLIRMFADAGFIYHSEVVIWKDPVTAMQRTKAIGLLYKQLKKDSALSRQGIPDYLVTMRKPGENPMPITKDPEEFPVALWQRYASPVWMDINPSDTLQKESAREHDDERHIAPLQLEVIRRAIRLWTNPGDLVLSPFMGIGSEGYVALAEGRRFVGVELKHSYFKQAVANLKRAEQAAKQVDLFAAAGIEVAD